MKRTMKLGAVAAMLIGATGAASASTAFIFNPTGAGFGAGAVTATTIDQAPGNALAVGGQSAVLGCLGAAGYDGTVGVWSCGAGVALQFTYQANLAQLTNLGTPVFDQNDGGRNFTFTASLTEVVTQVAVLAVGPGGVPTQANANFTIAPAQSANFFRMYATGGTAGNDLTGAGFTSANLILAGSATASSSTSTTNSSCQFTTAGCVNLDNFAGDDWNSFNTVLNNGSTQITISVTAANAGYFPNLPIGTLITLDVNTSQVVPFFQANPSCAMINPTTGAAQGYALGAIDGNGNCVSNGQLGATTNGLAGVDFLFQADANSSMQFVPEPGSLTLLAGSLMAAGLWGRRRPRSK